MPDFLKNSWRSTTQDVVDMPAYKISTSIVSPTVQPALSPSVHLGLTWTYVILYSLLFLIVYVQLWMILYYKHKRFSYQTVFLFLCLIWAGLRMTLFSFYFFNCILANNLSMFPDWLLYCLPVCLQFITLTLLVLYFSQVVFKTKAKFEPHKYKRPVWVTVGISIVIFVATNITCAVLTFQHRRDYDTTSLLLIQIRVIVNDSLFVIFGIFLSCCIYKIAKISSADLVLEAKGTTRCQSLSACVIIVLLYTSRAVYNIVAINCRNDKCHIPGFGFNWINVSDQADQDLDKGYSFLTFGVVLFIWEFLPTFIVVIFFRVKRPTSTLTVSDMSSHSHGSRAYFFDNPRSLYDISSSPYAINAGTPRQNSFTPRMSTPRAGGMNYGATRTNSRPSSYSGQYAAAHNNPPVLFAQGSQQQPFYDGT
ncbi:G protein-coupled receptor 137Ba-like isoform X2 [Lineus longissimus]|uniref:G protein-coupled receptor 137Ba-like isoform X2 n=1 Tax=Lineus longissimus TaxID=88925 RepID=UPI00315CE786